MILIKDGKEFTLKHIDYDLLQVIIRGLKHEKNNVQENISSLIVENMNNPEQSETNQKQIEFLKSLRVEIYKLLEDYTEINM
jgi:hypothetical protein